MLTGALTAFRSLVETVAHLHRTGIVHRDIKPANIFLKGQKLIPGDFGIAYTGNNTFRLTLTHERVGPWDYMPQWADTGERFDDVKPCFDVYMLGKLLWCMVSGRLRLPREYHRRPEFDLSRQFPGLRQMDSVNLILDKCLVEHANECIPSAVELLKLIDETTNMALSNLRVDGKGAVEMPCLVCGHGSYVEETVAGRVNLPRFNNNNVAGQPIFVRSFSCNVCTHRAFFAPGFPNEAVKPKWKQV
jgi:serine/threonine protein kinase